MWLELGIHASHGPDNRTAPLEQTQIVGRPDTPPVKSVAAMHVT
jgi:hypothetical protein